MRIDYHAFVDARPRGARRRPPSLIDVTLDPAQRAAVARPPGDALLVLGEAGHGKTTTALHRLAHLWARSRAQLRAAVVVPTEGLARLIQPLLRRLGVEVAVQTYDAFAAAHDASAGAYPADEASRRALYVAVTRARHQVVLAHA